MSKQKLRYGNKFIKCPMCESQTFDYCSYSECYGAVEQHGYCDRCGYTVNQAYSSVFEAFYDTKKGFKNYFGEYCPKNVKKHIKYSLDKQFIKMNCKCGFSSSTNIKNIEVNPKWVFYV